MSRARRRTRLYQERMNQNRHGMPGRGTSAGPTDPLFANVVLLTDFTAGTDGELLTNETAPDLSNYARPLTYDPLYARYDDSTSKWGTTAMRPTGATAQGTVTGDLSHFNFGTGDWTVEYWQYSTLVNNQGFAGLYLKDGVVVMLAVGTVANGAYGNVAWQFQGQSLTLHPMTIGETVDATWEHFAMCKDGSTVYFYISGVMVHSVTYGSADISGVDSVEFIDADAAINADITTWTDSLRVSDVARYPGGTSFDVPATKFIAA